MSLSNKKAGLVTIFPSPVKCQTVSPVSAFRQNRSLSLLPMYTRPLTTAGEA